MKKLALIIVAFILTVSCQQEETTNVSNEELNLKSQSLENKRNEPTNWSLIEENLKIYMNSQSGRASSGSLYFCSEILGGYTPQTFLTSGYYLNNLYLPSGSKYSGLQEKFEFDFADTNPSGTNSANINIEFEIYGANGGHFLNSTEADRVYNEFICQIEDYTNVSYTLLSNDLYFGVDYLTCCVGSTCCLPVFWANGIVYWN